jgi:hypothetical protein
MLRDFLNREGISVGRKHVATLMRRMGIEALVPQAEHQQVGTRRIRSTRTCCAV